MLTKHKQTIKELKSMILKSRYRAATLANKELLLLYFSVGRLIVERSETESWGSGVLDRIATDLQAELPGLRGFSTTSLKKMRLFYTEWSNSIRPLLTDELAGSQKKRRRERPGKINNPEIGPLLTDQFKNAFFSVGFTHHYEILVKAKAIDERVFYIHKTFEEFLSVENLINSIKSNTFKKRGTLLNNFSQTITDKSYREKALLSFKDEYLFDFMNIEDADFADEREIENEIIRNIRKFILSIGTEFTFIGNQHRQIVDGEEFFVDLLFFNRKLQCLVAFDLKKGKFKPEYLGKMNFYLSALDDMVKLPHENPSIGIILCKSKTARIVEFSFRDFNKAMGVATYKTSKELPAKYKGILPDPKALKELL